LTTELEHDNMSRINDKMSRLRGLAANTDFRDLLARDVIGAAFLSTPNEEVQDETTRDVRHCGGGPSHGRDAAAGRRPRPG
jgi:hypothetical protein